MAAAEDTINSTQRGFSIITLGLTTDFLGSNPIFVFPIYSYGVENHRTTCKLYVESPGL